MVHEASADKLKQVALRSGEKATLWSITSRSGFRAEILDLGATLVRLPVPRPEGDPVDVVLGYEDLSRYETDSFFLGAVAGRVAGRIAHGELRIEGETFSLDRNEGDHHLHGGENGLHAQLWDAQPVIDEESGSASLVLRYTSPDGEGGYPGRVDITCTYTVTAQNELCFETAAITDRATPINLTHHSYFNLAGGDRGISTRDQAVYIRSDEVSETDAAMIHTGGTVAANHPVMDESSARQLGAFVDDLPYRHGDLYRFDPAANGEVRLLAGMSCQGTGIGLQILSNTECLQFYGGEGFDGSLVGKGGVSYPSRAGVCFECQGHPQAWGEEGSRFASILVHPGEVQKSKTIYRFIS